MISCTHTHSGPGSMPCRVMGRGDEVYQDQLVKKIAGAVYLDYSSHLHTLFPNSGNLCNRQILNSLSQAIIYSLNA